MIDEIKQVLYSVLDVLLPRFCPVCGKRLMTSEEVMCISCLKELPLLQQENSRDNDMLRQLWSFAAVEHGLSLMYYRAHTPHHNLLMQFKYRGNAMLAYKMGKLAAQLQSHHRIQEEIDLVVPVPLSLKRRIQRGYNQAEWLARGVANTYGLPIETNLLKRVKHRNLQTQLNREERQANAKELYQACIRTNIKGKHILLVDDVCTTGATLAACAKALQDKDKGIRVSVFTLAWSGE